MLPPEFLAVFSRTAVSATAKDVSCRMVFARWRRWRRHAEIAWCRRTAAMDNEFTLLAAIGVLANITSRANWSHEATRGVGFAEKHHTTELCLAIL
jgi:hypothetical protein